MLITSTAQYNQRKIRLNFDEYGNITSIKKKEGLEALRRYHDGVDNPASLHYQAPISASAKRALRDLLEKHGVPTNSMNRGLDLEQEFES